MFLSLSGILAMGVRGYVSSPTNGPLTTVHGPSGGPLGDVVLGLQAEVHATGSFTSSRAERGLSAVD